MGNKRIAILGAGNIGLSIAEGILKSRITRERITITRRLTAFSKEEKRKFNCINTNKNAVINADIVVIAVQPKQVDDLLSEIKDNLTKNHLLISVVSGLSIAKIEELIGKKIQIVRSMPNTAIKVGSSMTCLAFNESGIKCQTLVKNIFDSVGISLVIPEALFPEATVLCGSGTALALKFARAFMQAGIQHGFNEKDALIIASQVLKGASMIIQDGLKHPESEIDKVTTPGGCTIAALAEMEHAGFGSSLLRAIKVAIEKARKLYS